MWAPEQVSDVFPHFAYYDKIELSLGRTMVKQEPLLGSDSNWILPPAARAR